MTQTEKQLIEKLEGLNKWLKSINPNLHHDWHYKRILLIYESEIDALKQQVEQEEKNVIHKGTIPLSKEWYDEINSSKPQIEEEKCNHKNWIREYNYKKCIDCGFTFQDKLLNK
jgi:hypothetical protein